jgi:hypothetical protein
VAVHTSYTPLLRLRRPGGPPHHGKLMPPSRTSSLKKPHVYKDHFTRQTHHAAPPYLLASANPAQTLRSLQPLVLSWAQRLILSTRYVVRYPFSLFLPQSCSAPLTIPSPDLRKSIACVASLPTDFMDRRVQDVLTLSGAIGAHTDRRDIPFRRPRN